MRVLSEAAQRHHRDRKSTRLNSSHDQISYAVFCLKKKKHTSELQSRSDLVCRLLLEKKNNHRKAVNKVVERFNDSLLRRVDLKLSCSSDTCRLTHGAVVCAYECAPTEKLKIYNYSHALSTNVFNYITV